MPRRSVPPSHRQVTGTSVVTLAARTHNEPSSSASASSKAAVSSAWMTCGRSSDRVTGGSGSGGSWPSLARISGDSFLVSASRESSSASSTCGRVVGGSSGEIRARAA